MFRLRDVGKSFPDGTDERWIFRNLTTELLPGESVALWGPSGSGKSTLLNVLAGLMDPSEGRVEYEHGQTHLDLTAASDRQRTRFRRDSVGFIYQFFNLVPTLTVRENVELPIELTGRKDLLGKALERLTTLGVAERADAFPATLSGGEQQRVAIARALAHRPKVVLADEPTGNLDARNSDQVLDLLWREAEELGCMLVIASHSERVLHRAARVIELNL